MSNFNILPPGYKGFMVHKEYSRDYEAQVILTSCSINNFPFRLIRDAKDYDANWIPVGNIKFIQDIIGKIVTPDYYPEFFSKYIQRRIWRPEKWPLDDKVFIKPADEYKRFNGFVTNGGYKGKKRGPYICSEVVKFRNEWRYYVCQGEILYAGWYAGAEIDKEAPVLDIVLDRNLCLCLDMGELLTGELRLVESQHPFSCGWYGKNTIKEADIYARWVANGWEYTRKVS